MSLLKHQQLYFPMTPHITDLRRNHVITADLQFKHPLEKTLVVLKYQYKSSKTLAKSDTSHRLVMSFMGGRLDTMRQNLSG